MCQVAMQQQCRNSNTVKKISDSKKIRTAQSYDEIYKYIKRSQDNSGIAMYARNVNETAAVEDSVSTGRSTASSTETASADTGVATADGSYSQTNVRQSGVDEGDIAKTDGTYLYVREDNGRTIDIVDVGNSGTNIEKYSEITLGKEYTIQEFYVNTDQKKLVAVCQKECADKSNKSRRTQIPGIRLKQRRSLMTSVILKSR